MTINKFKKTGLRLKPTLLKQHIDDECDLHIVAILEWNTRGVVMPWRHIFKREYDFRLIGLWWRIVKSLVRLGFGFVKLHLFMCTDFKRTNKRVVHFTLHVPLKMYREFVKKELAGIFNSSGLVSAFEIEDCDPTCLPFETKGTLSYITED